MNPNQNFSAPSTDDTNNTMKSGSSQPQNFPQEDDFFIIKPPEKKPLDKKSVFFVITLSVIGIILLIVVLVFALIGSASNLANDYRRLALGQIIKLEKPLSELEPSAVLNQRNLDNPSRAISLSKQSQPSLESVLFVGAWSERYIQTAALEKKLHSHYQHIEKYHNDVKKTIEFDAVLSEIASQEPTLAATINPSDSLSIRSASGSYEDFAKTIKNQGASSQINDTQKQLAEIYQKKADIYAAWAVMIEAGNKGGEAQAKADLLTESGRAAVLLEDENFVSSLKPSYDSLVKEHAQLKKQLAN